MPPLAATSQYAGTLWEAVGVAVRGRGAPACVMGTVVASVAAAATRRRRVHRRGMVSWQWRRASWGGMGASLSRSLGTGSNDDVWSDRRCPRQAADHCGACRSALQRSFLGVVREDVKLEPFGADWRVTR